MGRNRGDHGEGGTGGLKPTNKTGKICGQAIAISRAHEIEHPRSLGMRHNEVEHPATCLMRFEELLIVMRRGANAQSANQADASVIHQLVNVRNSAYDYPSRVNRDPCDDSSLS